MSNKINSIIICMFALFTGNSVTTEFGEVIRRATASTQEWVKIQSEQCSDVLKEAETTFSPLSFNGQQVTAKCSFGR